MVSDSSFQVAPPSSVWMRVPHSPTAQAVFASSACDPEQVRALFDLEVGLQLPGLAAVGGAQDRARLPHGPAIVAVGHRHRVEELLRAGGALVPAVAAILRPIGRSVIADRDGVLLVGDGDREQIVVDVDVAGLGARREVMSAATERRDRDDESELEGQARVGHVHRGGSLGMRVLRRRSYPRRRCCRLLIRAASRKKIHGACGNRAGPRRALARGGGSDTRAPLERGPALRAAPQRHRAGAAPDSAARSRFSETGCCCGCGPSSRAPPARAQRRARWEARSAARLAATLGELKGPFVKAGQFAANRHDLLPALVDHAARRAARSGAAPALRGGARRGRIRARRAAVRAVRGVRARAAGRRVDRPGPPRAAAQRRDRGGEGAVPVARRARCAPTSPGRSAALRVFARRHGAVDRAAPLRGVRRGIERRARLRARGPRRWRDRAQPRARSARGGAARLPEPRLAPRADDELPARRSRSTTARASRACRWRPRAVLEILARAYAKQVFVDGLFHADPHPGNLFVIDEPSAAANPRLLFVDFGLSRRLEPGLRHEMRLGIFALLQRDERAFLDGMQRMGMIAPGAREGVARAIAAMFGRIAGGGGALGGGAARRSSRSRTRRRRCCRRRPGSSSRTTCCCSRRRSATCSRWAASSTRRST